jgi:hypothetical protein
MKGKQKVDMGMQALHNKHSETSFETLESYSGGQKFRFDEFFEDIS